VAGHEVDVDFRFFEMPDVVATMEHTGFLIDVRLERMSYPGVPGRTCTTHPGLSAVGDANGVLRRRCGWIALDEPVCERYGRSMTTEFLGFALAATLLILVPGPDSMLVMRNVLRGGRSAGACTAAGTVTGLLIWAFAAALGVSSLVAASRVGYDVLRIAGAAYLILLGATTLRPRSRRSPSARCEHRAPSIAIPVIRPRRAYLNGVISNLCNPKIGVFFITFLPGFIPVSASVRELSLLLGVWFVVETGMWLAVLVWMVDRGVDWLRRPAVRRRLEQLTGLVLIGLGIRLATEIR
jgi:threonine/homoserine/homoserine lactone efflux protein